jgi:hypothetical protein
MSQASMVIRKVARQENASELKWPRLEFIVGAISRGSNWDKTVKLLEQIA